MTFRHRTWSAYVNSPDGGYRVPCDRRAVTVGNEAMVGRSPNLALRLASATCPLKPACSCSFAADTFARPCSSVCSRDAMDQGSGARRRETPRLPVQDGCWTRWTSGAFVDAGRLTHNPEVAGSNPAPATNFRRSRPFPIGERAFCVTGNVTKGACRCGMPWPDRRDGLARSETARNPVDDAACDLWAPLPEVAQAPSLLPLMLNCENGDRAELRREQHVLRRRQDAWPSMRAVAAQVATRV